MYVDNKPDLLELYHHGIKGQEWGVKNGPPYPLDRETKRKTYGSSKERLSNKEFKKRVKNFNNLDHDRYENYVKAFVKEALYQRSIVGLAKRNREARLSEQKYEEERDLARIDKRTGLKIKSDQSMTREEDMKRVNPAFNDIYEKTKNNCTLCAFTYDMRRRGFDVTANGAVAGYYPEKVINKVYKNGKFLPGPSYSKKRDYSDNVKPTEKQRETYRNEAKAMINKLKSENNSRGVIAFQWFSSQCGHVVNYETRNGKFQLIDSQIGKIYSEKESINYLVEHTSMIDYCRLDELTPIYNNMKKITH